MKDKEEMQGRPQFGGHVLQPSSSSHLIIPQFLSSLNKQSAPHFSYDNNNNNEAAKQSRDRTPGVENGSELSPLLPSPLSSRPPVSGGDGFHGGLKGLEEDESNKELGDDDGGFGGSVEGGSRWPRQETLALLKIRSEMDTSFRDATLKAPLWEQVSRRLAELGYRRNAKKCKEKFENVTKYYKRTKDGKSGRQHGKTYRFFNQLEALYSNNRSCSITDGSSGALQVRPASQVEPKDMAAAGRPPAPDLAALSFSSESSDDYDDGIDNGIDNNNSNNERHKRKRKRMSFEKLMTVFEKLMERVIEKQEMMQQRFLETIEKREQDRMIREEAWKRQEMARLSRENELRSQERAVSASRDAAILSFLEKLTGQTLNLPQVPLPQQIIHPPREESYNEREVFDLSCKRWPKQEVQTLIKVRSELEPRFHETGPKAPLWDQISAEMARLGFRRSAKRCKEKWENINKYFRKAKESNKDRPENANTCPYFHQLEELYSKGVIKYSSSEKVGGGRSRSHDQQEEELVEQTTCGSSRDDQSPFGVENENSATTAVQAPVASYFPADQTSSNPNNINNNNNICFNNAFPAASSNPNKNNNNNVSFNTPVPTVSDGLSCRLDSANVMMIQDRQVEKSDQHRQSVEVDRTREGKQADLDLPYIAAVYEANKQPDSSSFMAAMVADPPEFTTN